jgi:hypothetical protein
MKTKPVDETKLNNILASVVNNNYQEPEIIRIIELNIPKEFKLDLIQKELNSFSQEVVCNYLNIKTRRSSKAFTREEMNRIESYICNYAYDETDWGRYKRKNKGVNKPGNILAGPLFRSVSKYTGHVFRYKCNKLEYFSDFSLLFSFIERTIIFRVHGAVVKKLSFSEPEELLYLLDGQVSETEEKYNEFLKIN